MSLHVIRRQQLADLNTKQNLVTFVQDEMGKHTGHRAQLDDPIIATTDDGDFRDFFSRPIKIRTLTWAEGAALSGNFGPWYDYFSNTIIANKLKGFSRIRANLHLRFLVNGSPFRYGDVMFSYKPLWCASATTGNNSFPYFSGGVIASDLNSSYPGGVPPGVSSTGLQAILARSQRKHLHVYPQTNSGGDMILPFVYPRDSLNLNDAMTPSTNCSPSQFAEMGSIYYDTLVNLTTTASPNVNPVTITIMAWCEDVMLWGPTGLTINGGETDQPIDRPSAAASAVAEAAGKLKNLPVIGPYATATNLAASTVASTLRLFGFSNPPVVVPQQASINKVSFTNPSPIVSQAIDVLALDPKNELTIDPGIAGCQRGHDELDISWLCSRPAIFDVVTWQNSDAADAVLAALPVMPTYARMSYITNTTSPSANGSRITMAPATYFSQLFRYWRGTMVLKVKVVCSAFHRGRLCVSYDPISSTADVTGSRICKVLDLATADEIELEVPMMNTWGFLSVPSIFQGMVSPLSTGATLWGNRTSSYTYDLSSSGVYAESANGTVLITVLTGLQAGDTTANASLVLSVAFKDMQFMCPRADMVTPTAGGFGTTAAFAMRNVTLNGGEEPTGQSVEEKFDVEQEVDHLALVYGGERVHSMRSLLHRSAFFRAVTYTTTTARSLIRINMPRFPIPRFCRLPLVFDSMTGSLGSAFGTNFCNTTPLPLVTGCFTGYRGSIVWSAATTEGYTGKGCYLSGLGRTNYLDAAALTVTDLTTQGNSSANLSFANSFGTGLNGLSTALQSNSGVVSSVFPMYSNYKMFPGNMSHPYYQCTNPPNWEQTSMGMKSDFINFIGVVNAAATNHVLFSCAAGSDFTVFGFLNCPDLYLPIATPA